MRLKLNLILRMLWLNHYLSHHCQWNPFYRVNRLYRRSRHVNLRCQLSHSCKPRTCYLGILHYQWSYRCRVSHRCPKSRCCRPRPLPKARLQCLKNPPYQVSTFLSSHQFRPTPYQQRHLSRLSHNYLFRIRYHRRPETQNSVETLLCPVNRHFQPTRHSRDSHLYRQNLRCPMNFIIFRQIRHYRPICKPHLRYRQNH